MMPNDPQLDRLADLALEGAEADDLSLALTAAAASLALGAASNLESAPIPESLRARLVLDAQRHFAEAEDRRVTPPGRASKAWRVAACVGWLAAAASWLLPAWPALQPRPVDRRPDVAQAKAVGWLGALKASDHPLAREAKGEVVWNQATQAGQLRLTGLAAVDPKQAVYQLWIFDAKRDPRYPVDGGTFTLADPSTPATIDVRARLHVDQPKLFAITLEPTGGVVVSDRQRVMLSASYP